MSAARIGNSPFESTSSIRTGTCRVAASTIRGKKKQGKSSVTTTHALAASAARAGAQEIDDDAARLGHAELDQAAAEAAAAAFLERTGTVGTVTAFDDHVDVGVRMVAHPVLLGIVGQGDKDITGHGSARIIRGI